MTERILEPLVIPSADPAAILPDLQEAIAGQRSLLPLPDNDPARAQLLRTTQRAGQEIDPEVALVVGTSGSTGTPKGAELTALNLVSSADATHQALGLEDARNLHIAQAAPRAPDPAADAEEVWA